MFPCAETDVLQLEYLYDLIELQVRRLRGALMFDGGPGYIPVELSMAAHRLAVAGYEVEQLLCGDDSGRRAD